MDKNNIYKATYEVINENYFEWGAENEDDFAMFVEGVLCTSNNLLDQFTKKDIKNADCTC